MRNIEVREPLYGGKITVPLDLVGVNYRSIVVVGEAGPFLSMSKETGDIKGGPLCSLKVRAFNGHSEVVSVEENLHGKWTDSKFWSVALDLYYTPITKVEISIENIDIVAEGWEDECTFTLNSLLLFGDFLDFTGTLTALHK